MMIDWVTMKIPCHHKGVISNGSVVKVSKDNEIEWLTQSWLPVVGSHDATIAIRSLTTNTLEISGNPAKFLQGHNLFGTNDLKRLVWLLFQRLLDIPDLNLKPCLEQQAAVKAGNYTISRIDINETWFLRNRSEVLAWLRAAEQRIRLKHRGAGQFKGDTLYWGKGSKRWFLKCYSKGDEINSKKSNFPDALRTPQMLAYADRALRLELTLKSNHLREMLLHLPSHWQQDTAKLLLLNALNSLEMSNNMRLTNEKLDTLKPSVKMAYFSWLAGEDLKAQLTRPTFYRYRSQLRELGIDIAIVRDSDQDNDVIPLMRILEAEPVGIPDWAYEQNLVAV